MQAIITVGILLYIHFTVETMDYGTLDVILMFDECERRRCVNVSITEDLVDEPDEFFIFHLNRTTGLNPRIELDPVDGIIEIVDDDSEQCTSVQ